MSIKQSWVLWLNKYSFKNIFFKIIYIRAFFFFFCFTMGNKTVHFQQRQGFGFRLTINGNNRLDIIISELEKKK